MQVTMMKGKLHRATVTEADIDYEGSVGIDRDLIDHAGFLLNEQVDILNITNGERFTTYVIEAERGSRKISINGAAAHKASAGDLVIICAYGIMDIEEAKNLEPSVVLIGENNKIKKSNYTEKQGRKVV